MNKKEASIHTIKEYLRGKGTLFVLIAMILFSWYAFGSTFMSWSNISNVLRQMSWFGMAAIGVNLCIIAGGRDVSVGYTAMLTGMVFTYCITKMGMSLWIALLIALCVGPLVGIVNGFIIAKLQVRAMIATLSIGWILSAFGLIINNDATIYISKKTPYINLFYNISRSDLFGFMPTPFFIFLVLVFAFWYFSTRTSIGRAIYAIGGDSESASMMGINVVRTQMITHFICSVLACIAGLFLVARTGVGDPASCSQWGFTMMSTVVIGGTRMRGGRGDIRGIIIGVLIYGMIGNILTMAGMTKYWQDLITGLVLLMAILSQNIK